MRSRYGLWLVLAIIGGIGAIAEAQPSGEHPPCVELSHSAPYRGYGYNHIVHIRNGCDRSVHCRVTTSSNPEASEVDVPSNESRSVQMFMGSPAREFRSTVNCE